MKHVKCLLGLAILLMSCNAPGQTTVSDWIGEFELNQNGEPGTLVIRNSSQPCAGTPWCGLTIALKGAKETHLQQGHIVSMDTASRRMRFDIVSLSGAQAFEAFLFTGDKSAMAGTFRSGSAIFGFYAKKTGNGDSGPSSRSGQPALGTGRKAAISATGEVEIHYPDGRTVLPNGCRTVIIEPDGKRRLAYQCIETQPPTPPPPPQDSRWALSENATLLSIMKALVNDDTMVQDYVRSEGNGKNVYQILGSRIDTINKLLAK
ncbi:MAG TPA: hypothetical protein VKV30_10080 [Candidatus Angelobacter sp.]|nr:hypothetical protein [Candidatus Angelobacter sp.]